ncbi:hypothetical protein [Peribacillus simplex]|uniref:spermine/spermidine synthase domain-containing protein n=1 Tax=Peribacillus simplex TaxID=1478 RepID=UPI0011A6F577|nr:hypothetical protein [Peribacillus simplex]
MYLSNTSDHERVLILGGGDGLALREVLKYPNVKHVDLVDIDPLVIGLVKTNPKLITQNNCSLLDERVNIHSKDAKKFILRELQPYKVIIVPSFGLWGFHLASHFKLPRIIPSISVQHQALISDMRICLLFLR